MAFNGSYIDVAISSRASALALSTHDSDIKALIVALNNLSAGDVWTYASRTLTSPTFGNLVTKNLADIIADEIAFNGADIGTILSEIQNGSYGLYALKVLIDAVEGKLDNGTYGLSALRTLLIDIEGTGFTPDVDSLVNIRGYVDEIEGLLKNASYGLSALKTLIDAVEGKLDNATYGLNALKTLITAIEGKLDNATYGLSALNTDLDTLLSRLTATRAGYLDNLSGGAVALASVCTEARLAELGATNIPADIDTLLSRLTAARAGYLDNINQAGLLQLTATRAGYLDNLSGGAVALASVCTATRLSELDPTNIPGDIDTLLARLTATRAGYLDNLSGGAVALASVCTEVRLAELGATNIPADIDTLLARLTATRAGYLDNLSGGAVATQTSVNRKVSCMTFWSDVSTTNPIQLTTPAADKDLPNVVVANIPSGATIIQAIVLIKIRAIENKSSSGYNAINGAQNIRIKVSTGTWGVDDIAAINLIDNQWYIAASTREFGDVQVGDNDVKSVVTGNATYNLRFEDALVDYQTLDLFDVQVGIRIWFY